MTIRGRPQRSFYFAQKLEKRGQKCDGSVNYRIGSDCRVHD